MLLLTILLLCDWLSFTGREADSILPRMPRLRNWKYLSSQLLSMHLADRHLRLQAKRYHGLASFLFLACQLQSAHLETSVSLFSSQLLGTEVACRDLAPSLPSMKTDTLGKQDHCCGCWCPPSVLAVLITSAELFLPEAVETVPVSSQIGSDGKSPTAYTCTAGD